MSKLLLLSLTSIVTSCQSSDFTTDTTKQTFQKASYQHVGDIPPPKGYTRIEVAPNSFGEWLRTVSLKKDKLVYLYNGKPKEFQSAQFAVMDISVGNRDLQQCADAVMRLRAEYLLLHDPDSISFISTSRQVLSFANWRQGIRYKLAGNRLQAYTTARAGRTVSNDFIAYMELVFNYCGTQSLQQQMKRVANTDEIMPGYVFVKGGFPGHAMIVVDVAINDKGRKVFMLAQSYMPAQDIHIVLNPVDEKMSPWYEVGEDEQIITPEWTFDKKELSKW